MQTSTRTAAQPPAIIVRLPAAEFLELKYLDGSRTVTALVQRWGFSVTVLGLCHCLRGWQTDRSDRGLNLGLAARGPESISACVDVFYRMMATAPTLNLD